MYDRGSLDAALVAMARADRWSVVALDYELGELFEPTTVPAGRGACGKRALARVWQFDDCRVFGRADEAEAWLAAASGERVAGVGGARPAISRERYLAGAERVQRYIAEGDCYQVNLTFPLDFSWYGDPLALYARLRTGQPVRYGGVLANGAEDGAWDDAEAKWRGIVSLSPELFVDRRGGRLLTRPMKGTAPRALPQGVLAASAKDRAENLMIVDLLRNDLGRLARPGSVRVERLFAVEEYPTVWQMVSDISAEVGNASWGALLAALFPCGSITGAPKIRAMQIAAELEGRPRGIYTGALGWIDPAGNGRLNVAIRTLELFADHTGRLGLGSGVVADSVPAAEWSECLLKGAFMTRQDPGVVLIETLRCDNGHYPRLDGHLVRLARSAAWFGFPFDEVAVRAALAAVAGEGRQRVRLLLDAQGTPAVTGFPLQDIAPGTCWAELSSRPIVSANPLRRHKTTARAEYDEALAALAGDPAVFDCVFLNERGEVAEGARSNVFVERDGVLLTPPVDSGALPGVLRGELLASGQAREAVLTPADLAGGFWLGNALRGLLPVRLRSTGKNG